MPHSNHGLNHLRKIKADVRESSFKKRYTTARILIGWDNLAKLEFYFGNRIILHADLQRFQKLSLVDSIQLLRNKKENANHVSTGELVDLQVLFN